MNQVSVIIPTFNSAPWLGQAIESALNQTVAPHEVIVIDDGSTDNTAKLLGFYGQSIRCFHQHNQGVAAARNTGLSKVTGDLIAFLDADDIWHPRKLEFQLQALTIDIGLLGTGMFPATQDLPCHTNTRLPRLRTIRRNALAVKNYLATSSLLMRRAIAEQAGTFDTTLQGPEDHDYWLRAAEIANIVILPIPLTGFREVPGSLSKRATTMETGILHILQKLDARDYWQGNNLLRQRAYSYANYSAAYLYGLAGDQRKAIIRSLRSLAWYPLPYSRREAGVSFGRFRRLGISLKRLAGGPVGSAAASPASPIQPMATGPIHG